MPKHIILTPEQKVKYLADPTKCPHCGSGDITGDSVEIIHGREAVQDIDCNACNASWADIYLLADVMDLRMDDLENQGENNDE